MRRLLPILCCLSCLGAEPATLQPEPTVAEPLSLALSGRLDTTVVPECSALLASRAQERVLWTLSDSGNAPRLVAIRPNGLILQPDPAAPAFPTTRYLGVEIAGARNVDWEALAADDAGNLVIGDVGNNLSRRRELVLYFVPEPRAGAASATPSRRVTFAWPDQVEFPDPEFRHDCEAMFWYRGRLHLLTKHRRDTRSELWRAEIPASSTRAYLTQVGSFDARGMVTDASVSPDGRHLAVLTYRMLWVFDLSGRPDNPLSGPALGRPILPPAAHWQVEGCGWIDDATLLLGAEQGGLFRVKLSDLSPGR